MTDKQIINRLHADYYTVQQEDDGTHTAYKCGYFYNMPTLQQLHRILFEKKNSVSYTDNNNFFVISVMNKKNSLECQAFRKLQPMTLQEFLELPEVQAPLTSWRKMIKFLKIQKIQHTTKIHNFGKRRDQYAQEKLETFKTVPLCYPYYPTLSKSNLFYEISFELRGIEIRLPTSYKREIIFL